VNARSFYTAAGTQIVCCTLSTEDGDIDLVQVDVSIEVPSRFELEKARIKNSVFRVPSLQL